MLFFAVGSSDHMKHGTCNCNKQLMVSTILYCEYEIGSDLSGVRF